MTTNPSLHRGTDSGHYELKYYENIVFDFVDDEFGNYASTTTTVVTE